MTLKIKAILLAIAVILFGLLGWIVYGQHQKIKNLDAALAVASNNNKAYEAENDSLHNKIIEFQFTSDQLNASNDSLVRKLNSVRKQLGIKDKEISHLQYLVSQNQKKDTVVLKDTIFREGVVLDTLLGDEWSRLKLHAEYPNFISADYSFKNSTVVVAHDSRVTVDPPKKCWLARLFQKKQTIVEIDVVQENPYCENKTTKFIKVIK